MKRFLLFAIAVFLSWGGAAWADDMVARNGNDSVRLTQGACFSEVLQLLKPHMHADVKAAYAVLDGKEFRGCWMVQHGFVTLLYEDGDEGRLPLSEFKRTSPI